MWVDEITCDHEHVIHCCYQIALWCTGGVLDIVAVTTAKDYHRRPPPIWQITFMPMFSLSQTFILAHQPEHQLRCFLSRKDPKQGGVTKLDSSWHVLMITLLKHTMANSKLIWPINFSCWLKILAHLTLTWGVFWGENIQNEAELQR